jgi:hypothetical protein
MSSALKTCLLTFLGVVVGDVAHAQSGPYQYYPLTPCRVVDTRNANSTNGGPALGLAVQRDFALRGNCGVPSTAKAVAMNIVVVNPLFGGYLTVWPSGAARPLAATLNFAVTDTALANGAIMGLSTNAQDLSVLNGSNGPVHVVIDVSGYFQ